MPRPKKKQLSKIDFSGSFYSDSTSENMEYAVILRSPQIGGKILDINKFVAELGIKNGSRLMLI